MNKYFHREIGHSKWLSPQIVKRTAMNEPEKRVWSGAVVSIQPRTTGRRYRLDNRTHSHIGYNLFLEGEANGLAGAFSAAISEKQQQKAQFRIGDKVKGTAWTKMCAVTEYADYYRAGALMW